MAIISLKKKSKESVLVVSRISSNLLDTLKANNVNISKTIREYLKSIADDMETKPKKRVS